MLYLLLLCYFVFVISLVVGAIFKLSVKEVNHLVLVKTHIALICFSGLVPVVVNTIVTGTTIVLS